MTEYLEKSRFQLIHELEAAQKQINGLRGELDRLTKFIDSAPVIFNHFDVNLKMININRTGINYFPKGTTKNDLLGRHLIEIIPGIEDTPRFQKYLEVTKTGKPAVINEFRMTPQFGQKYLSARAFKVDDGLGIITTDITELKEAEAKLGKVKREEELYHTMMGHFLKNDLQKVTFALELMGSQGHPTSHSTSDKIIKTALKSCHQASRTIDAVNKIFSVLQSKPEFTQSRSLFQAIQAAIKARGLSASVERQPLDVEVRIDHYFRDLLDEIFTYFAIEERHELKIYRAPPLKDYELVLTIQDNLTSPLPLDLSERLSTGITEEWESLGHFIGLTLASVITQFYGGKLKITPGIPQGNRFDICLPSSLIVNPDHSDSMRKTPD